MGSIVDKTNTVVGDSIVRDLVTNHIEIVSCDNDTASGITLTAGASGNIDFIALDLTNYVDLTESGVTGLTPVNGFTSIIGVLNQVGKFYISGNDTTADYAENKIVAVSGIVLTTLNDGGNEQLQISINPSALAEIIDEYILHNNLGGLQGGTSGERYHLTAQQLIDLTSGLSADDQHYHNASAIVVDDACFDLVSGTDLQTVLCAIDELLKTRNTMLVNFDIGGSVRNGNTSLGVANNVEYVDFRHDKEGLAAFSARVPENYIVGTALTFRIKWYSTGANTGDVTWQLIYKGIATGENVTIAGTTVTQTVTEVGVAGQLIETDFAISSSAFAIGDIMTFDLRRLGDNVLDTSTTPSRLVEVSLDY
jgi:hypothetical protein